MTAPEKPEPETKPATGGNTGKKYLVKTPWSYDVLQGNGKFPDVTPQGVEMNAEELKEATKASHALFLRLKVQEAK
jgi:hypothetical protein